MPTETIRYVVQGTNPQTNTSQVIVTPQGNATASVVLQSASAGVDTLQAFLDDMGLTSNQGQVIWQGTNGPIAIGPIQAFVMAGNDSGDFPPGLTSASFTGPQTFNSLMFNTHPGSLLPGDPHDNGNQANPFVNNAITSSGYYSGDIALNNAAGSFNMVLLFQFVVAQAGSITFACYANSGFVIGVQGASYVSGAQTFSGVNTTPFNNYPSLAGFNGPDWVFPSANYAITTFTLNFPTPGVFNAELCFTSGIAGERQLDLVANGAVIPPVTITTVPPTPVGAAAGAKISVTPTSIGPVIAGTAQTFNITLSNLVFETTPYLPILEGTVGEIFIANVVGTNQFTYPTTPGATQPFDGATAMADGLLTLSGDNDSWQGKLIPNWNGSGYTLEYNGAALDPNIATTELTVTAADLAWWNDQNDSFDIYAVTSLGGGSQASVAVYWLVSPAVSSYGPEGIAGDGTVHTFTFTLAKPLPPLQNNVACTATGGAGITVESVTATKNSAGWITGWTVSAFVAQQLTQTISSIALTVQGNTTYLVSNTFNTANITFLTAKSFAITIAAGS